MDKKVRYLLEESYAQIKRLRQLNTEQAARLQVYDDMMLLFKTNNFPNGRLGLEEDITWSIQNYIREQDKMEVEPKKDESRSDQTS